MFFGRDGPHSTTWTYSRENCSPVTVLANQTSSAHNYRTLIAVGFSFILVLLKHAVNQTNNLSARGLRYNKSCTNNFFSTAIKTQDSLICVVVRIPWLLVGGSWSQPFLFRLCMFSAFLQVLWSKNRHHSGLETLTLTLGVNERTELCVCAL